MHQLHFNSQSISGGRLCSFQTPSELPAQCYRGGLWGEWGGDLWHKAGGPEPAYLLLPAVASERQALHQMRPTAPRRDQLWIPCQKWLVKECKYSIDVPTIDLFPDPSYHGQCGRLPKEWSASSASHWLTEAEQVGREIERTRRGMLWEWGETLWTSDLVKRGLLLCKQLEKEEYGALWVRARSRRRHQWSRDGLSGLWSVAEWI